MRTEMRKKTQLQETMDKAKSTASDLRKYLPPKQNMMDLIGTIFVVGQYPVWNDPEPYAMEAGANAIDALLAEIEWLQNEVGKAEEARDHYYNLAGAAGRENTRLAREIEHLKQIIILQTRKSLEGD